ncbi:MAG: protocatechuate 3,4-dioxygenase subunit alpha [Pseudomonadota bacterium]
MVQQPIAKETPSQTAGPYVHIGLAPGSCGNRALENGEIGSVLYDAGVKGERITVEGTVFDGAGEPLRDALIEIWQADHEGIYKSPEDPRDPGDPAFHGFGRAVSSFETGLFRFETIMPGRVPTVDGRFQAPHMLLWIVARGINIGLHTRLYLPGDETADDPVLQLVDEELRPRLIAVAQGDIYRFDIHLQGENESVFFDN